MRSAGRSGRRGRTRTRRRSVASHASSTPGCADEREVHALGLDPQAELHPEARARSRASGRRPFGKRAGSAVHDAEAGIEVERAGRAGARVPAGVEHEQLDAERRGAIHFRAHRRFVDLGAVGEPGVVGDQRQRLARPPRRPSRTYDAQSAAVACGSAAGHDAEHDVRSVDAALESSSSSAPRPTVIVTARAGARSSVSDHAPDHISAA